MIWSIENRTDIKNFILQLENQFPVNQWNVNGIHVWPLIRITLYLYLIDKTEKKTKKAKHLPNIITANKKKNGRIQRYKTKAQKISAKFTNIYKFKKWEASLKKRDVVFVGADTHRATVGKTSYNKFYDPIIQQGIENSFYFLESGKILENATYTKDNLIDLGKTNHWFKDYYKLFHDQSSVSISLNGYDDLIHFFYSKFDILKDFTIRYDRLKIQVAILDFYADYVLLKKMFQKINPKRVYMLHYYGYPGFSVIAAANELNIKTIEVQHGPQTDLHLAYSNWNKLPNEGYAMLPRNYWCWENNSADLLKKTFGQNKNYTVEVKGNPWLSFDFGESTLNEQNYILYTLQPSPVTIETMFSEETIKIIKTSGKKWFIRFHPRQSESDINEIKKLLLTSVNNDLIEFEISNSLPLPLLLKNCLFHVTQFSGSALEAALFDKKTALLSPIGQSSFINLIKENKAEFFDTKKEDFAKNFFNFVQKTES